MQLKIGGALLLCCAGLGGGLLGARRLSLRRDFLSAFLTFLSRLSTALRFRNEEIVSLVNSSWELCRLPENDGGRPFGEIWQEAVSDFRRKWRLNARDMELIEEFGAQLGTTDAKGQQEHIALYRAYFEQQLTQAREDAARKTRLYKALGLFAGISAALMLW